MEILRGAVLHTPRNPFRSAGALETFDDGGLAIDQGRIAAVGSFAALRAAHPEAEVRDLRGGVLLPGFVDTHVHYPQIRVIGAVGHDLLEWLRQRALPEEVRFADLAHARAVAREFVRGLLRHGTTTALAFGAHFAPAQAALFEEAGASGLRLISGMVLSDRNLLPALHQTPDEAYEAGRALIRRFHGRGRLRYAVTPRFSLSASEAMLRVAEALTREAPDLHVQTHLNESAEEIATVRRLFPWARDYLDTYAAFGLVGPRSVFAHDVHPSPGELDRLAAARAAVAHCPSSNAFLGSGIFPMRRHLDGGVHFALGSDVGAGTGFGLLKEGLMAYLAQRLLPDGVPLTGAHLLYLATRAGAEALGLDGEVGDFTPGKVADIVHIRPTPGSTLAAVMAHAESAEHVIGALCALASEEAVVEVYLDGRPWRGDRGTGDALRQ